MDGHHGEQSGSAAGHAEPGGNRTTIKVNGRPYAIYAKGAMCWR